MEFNAHALITYLMTVRDSLPPKSRSFVPWMLGSQSCEKMLRTARSMSSTFSTVINFGMLGLMRRLHRMHIQACQEAESEETGIKYPRVEANKNKDGHHVSNMCCGFSLGNKDIVEAVERAREGAKKAIGTLGMVELLQKNQFWDNPPVPVLEYEDIRVSSDDDMDNEDTNDDNVIAELLQEANASQDPGDVASGVSQLTTEKVRTCQIAS